MKIANYLPGFNDLLSFWNQFNNDPKLKYITYKKEIDFKIEDIFKCFDGPQKTYWSSKNKSKKLISFGELKYFLNNHELKESHDFVDKNNQLIIIGSLPFDSEFNDGHLCRFKIPWLTYECLNNKTNIYLNISLKDIRTYDDLLNYYQRITENIIYREDKPFVLKKRVINEYPSFENWKKSIDKALSLIKNNKFKKIVLSRRINIEFENPIMPEEYFLKCAEIYSDKNSYQFFQKDNDHYFISYTPEKLFSMEKSDLNIDIIAGTIARGNTNEEDENQINKLKNSEKDLLEHRIVKKDIINQIESFSSQINVIKNEEILKLPNVFHLHGIIKVKIENHVPISMLIDSLHPTPAVGGYPRNEYEPYLKELEQKPRGPYAAPFGIISKNHTELSVGIRSLLINENKLTLFSGCGIVEGSNPKEEWDETDHKIKNLIITTNDIREKDKNAERTL